MDGVRTFFDGLASVAEAVAHEARLYNDHKDDIYHEWFSTLRVRYINQMKIIENKLNSKIVRDALEDTLRDMLQKNYEETNLRESAEERARRALKAVLLEYFTLRVIRLFILRQVDNNRNGFNINRSLFFNCLINASQASFNTTSDARELVHEVVQTCQTLRGEYY